MARERCEAKKTITYRITAYKEDCVINLNEWARSIPLNARYRKRIVKITGEK